ncbi:hypothetical protein [Prevotella jejuni]|jgi:hypothetical protein
MTKKIGKGYSLQIFSFLMLNPLSSYLINPIIEHFREWYDAIAYTKTYIGQGDNIRLTLPKDLLGQLVKPTGIVGLWRRWNLLSMRNIIYCSHNASAKNNNTNDKLSSMNVASIRG